MAFVYVRLDEVTALLNKNGFEEASEFINNHLSGEKKSKKKKGKKEKVKGNEDNEGFTIIMGYSKKENGEPKSHVLVGPIYKDEYNELRIALTKMKCKFNKNLIVGPGWILPSTRLGGLEDILHTFDIIYKKTTLEKYSSTESEYKVNKWGNRVHLKSNYVMIPLPTEDGNEEIVAIGVQDTKSKRNGVESLIGLDEEDREKCDEMNIPYLTAEMMNRLDVKKYGSLSNLLPTVCVSDEDSDSESESEDDL